MRVEDRQKRAKGAFTKPLNTHLTPDKGDFSCRATHRHSVYTPQPIGPRVHGSNRL